MTTKRCVIGAILAHCLRASVKTLQQCIKLALSVGCFVGAVEDLARPARWFRSPSDSVLIPLLDLLARPDHNEHTRAQRISAADAPMMLEYQYLRVRNSQFNALPSMFRTRSSSTSQPRLAHLRTLLCPLILVGNNCTAHPCRPISCLQGCTPQPVLPGHAPPLTTRLPSDPTTPLADDFHWPAEYATPCESVIGHSTARAWSTHDRLRSSDP